LAAFRIRPSVPHVARARRCIARWRGGTEACAIPMICFSQRRSRFCLEIGKRGNAIIAAIGRYGWDALSCGAVPLALIRSIHTGRGRQVVRQRSAKPLSAVRFRPAPPNPLSLEKYALLILNSFVVRGRCRIAATSPDAVEPRNTPSAHWPQLCKDYLRADPDGAGLAAGNPTLRASRTKRGSDRRPLNW
jgi:hypothetical protein